MCLIWKRRQPKKVIKRALFATSLLQEATVFLFPQVFASRVIAVLEAISLGERDHAHPAVTVSFSISTPWKENFSAEPWINWQRGIVRSANTDYLTFKVARKVA